MARAAPRALRPAGSSARARAHGQLTRAGKFSAPQGVRRGRARPHLDAHRHAARGRARVRRRAGHGDHRDEPRRARDLEHLHGLLFECCRRLARDPGKRVARARGGHVEGERLVHAGDLALRSKQQRAPARRARLGRRRCVARAAGVEVRRLGAPARPCRTPATLKLCAAAQARRAAPANARPRHINRRRARTAHECAQLCVASEQHGGIWHVL